MNGNQERLTARKVILKDIVNGRYFNQEGFKSNYLITPRGQRVSRVNVVGTVMTKFVTDDENYGFFVLDDETETVRVKFFQDLGMMDKADEGDMVRVIGKLREYDGEIYVNPEVVHTVDDPNHMTLHMTEVAKSIEQLENIKEDIEQMKSDDPDTFKKKAKDKYDEETVEAILNSSESSGEIGGETDTEDDDLSDLKEEVLEIIENEDDGEGTPYQDITENVDADEQKVDEVINDLLTEGTCFEPRPGKIKKL